MVKHILFLSAIISVHSFGLNLRFDDKSELSTETEAAFQKFNNASQTELYVKTAKHLSELPITNGALIDNCWLLTAAHSFEAIPYFYNQEYLNKLYKIGAPFQGDTLILENQPITRHPNYDLALVKIKPVNILPLKRIREESSISIFNPSTLFFSRTIHFGKPGNNMFPDMAQSLDRTGFFAELELKETKDYITTFNIQKVLGVKVRSYMGDSGNPILMFKDNIFKDEIFISGVAISMSDDTINVIKVNQPKINDWIDYTILSEVLK